MPKVSTLRISINGKMQEFAIYYSRTDKFYLKDFPDSVSAHQKQHKHQLAANKFETEQELIEHFRKLVDDYHELNSKVRKVIAYKIIAEPGLFLNPDMSVLPEFKHYFHTSYSGQSFLEKSGVGVHMKVMYEKTSNGLAYYEAHPDTGEISYHTRKPEDMRVIDWTPERQQFFDDLKEAMRGLLRKMVTYMGEPDQLTKLIESGQKLLK